MLNFESCSILIIRTISTRGIYDGEEESFYIRDFLPSPSKCFSITAERFLSPGRCSVGAKSDVSRREAASRLLKKKTKHFIQDEGKGGRQQQPAVGSSQAPVEVFSPWGSTLGAELWGVSSGAAETTPWFTSHLFISSPSHRRRCLTTQKNHGKKRNSFCLAALTWQKLAEFSRLAEGHRSRRVDARAETNSTLSTKTAFLTSTISKWCYVCLGVGALTGGNM